MTATMLIYEGLTYGGPTFWDTALALPIFLMFSLSFAAFIQVMAGPRIFRRPERRCAAAMALLVYGALALVSGPEAVSGRWQADAWLFVRSLAQAVPSLFLLIALQKLEKSHSERPLKSGPLASF